MKYRVVAEDAILYSAQNEDPTKIVTILDVDAELDTISDAGLPKWINVKVVSAAAPQGFVPVAKVEVVPRLPEIDPATFFLKALDAALDPASRTNHQYLFAVATAESKLRNVPSPIGGSDAFGPFQYTAARWGELVGKFGPSVGVNPGDRESWVDQVVIAAAEASHAAEELEAALDRVPVFNELCLMHVLANINSAKAMRVVTAATALEATVDVLQQNGWTEVDPLLERLVMMLPDGGQPPAPAELASMRRANVWQVLKEALAPGFNTAAQLGATWDPPDPPDPRSDAEPDPTQFRGAPAVGGISRYGQLARKVLDILKDKGWSPAQCCGVIANIYSESRFNERVPGDNGAAYGLCQWHSDRRKIFTKNFNKSMFDSDFGAQVEFIDVELNTTERRAGGKLKSQLTPGQAGFVVSLYYERPAGKENTANERAGVAQAFATLLGVPIV